MPARAPASIDMLQIVMRPSMESSRIACPRSGQRRRRTPVPILAMTADDVLRGQSPASEAADRDRHGLEGPSGRVWVASVPEPQRCRCQYEGTVRGGVVAAHDRHAGWVKFNWGDNDVNVPDLASPEVQARAELLGILAQRVDLRAARDAMGWSMLTVGVL